MKKKSLMVLTSVIVISFVAAMVGAGTFAFFTDTETSTGNTIQAGHIDLVLGLPYAEPGPTVFSCTGLAPGEETSEYEIYFKNRASSTLSGFVTVDISYTENDNVIDPDDGGPTDVSATAFAKKVYVSHADLDDGGNIASYWAKQIRDDVYGTYAAAVTAGAVIYDGDYLPTAYGLSQITLHFWTSYKGDDIIFEPGDAHHESIKLKLDSSVGNNYQYDGIDITITATITND